MQAPIIIRIHWRKLYTVWIADIVDVEKRECIYSVQAPGKTLCRKLLKEYLTLNKHRLTL